MKNVIIFSSLLLPPSQTFIRDPVEQFQEFKGYYVGSRRVEGLELPSDRTWVVNQGGPVGKLQEQIFKLTGFAPQLYAKIRALDPVLIHAQFGLSGTLALPWAKSLKIPLIVHYRGADATIRADSARYTSLNHWLYFQRLPQLQQDSHLFLTVCRFLQQKLLEQGFPPEKIITHYHGVDIQKFSPNPQISRQPTVLFVGRLTEKKGVKFLILAMSEVQQQLPNVKLVIIGDGPLKQDLETLAHQTLKQYQFLGVQPQTIVKTWMNQAQILATPSITSPEGDSEGLPNVILEAQAMGLPVVSTYHAGIPEVVFHEKTGFLTPEQDSQGLGGYILELFRNPELWQQFSREGREQMVKHFDRAQQTRRLEEIYLSVARKPT
ncbi:glycosyltransferase [Spirulina subsalsa FACHB-351]|uniref:Glycosyltransferase n=1 Tax=Spirulina subsalsa FACHB-351 TaxID=234711 RepID=A0ABT3LCJ2_9CYAN|nr:glycosyltransferase [Spirulina subsalsa]MCW6038847.1 glycosyltransferase [Spirulina subsalsa FACHB-351]